MSKKLKVAGIAGSLGSKAISKKFLKEVKKSFGEDVELTEILYADIPVYNADIEYPTPASVKRVRDELKEYDAIVIAMPEYNLSIPGSLKNLLDWLSRPEQPGQPKPVLDYPILVFSFSAGISGGMVPQELLRSLLSYLGASVMPQPRASFTGAYNLLDKDGNLVLDDTSKEFLDQSAKAFVAFAQ
ncbi:hypothetical protein AOC36_07490 [Erysipelothrix larvae]|uniref:NADPH-dependent FMN reductase-like domain-containing protein n=1 Tax=Erysipelothrix larvae TaxID=1514105 RepID=A0A0X8H0J5_9FIRM|nr:NADPH-dependent FMN reductase [Erysipelothrix larvae]AMC93832.1 hypothetical protein AOC36_07490 [Erysipelothrix larvae]